MKHSGIIDPNYMQHGRKKIHPVHQVQAGGFAILPAAAAIYAGLKTVQPFTKAKNWLASADLFNEKRDHTAYKVFKGIADAGSFAGFGEKKKKHRKRKSKR